ncbi:MAG TPA: HD domain-containing protein [Solirubrobacteraceae bacterium]|jgi:putative nucleotidyltransferase with HDIG domain|nr:HD domain-containing protein [Solirubrobacteraceae bacterium]
MSSDPLELARSALSGREAWLVGGAVRDRRLGRPLLDVDVVLDGDPGEAARAIAATARAAGAHAACFALSEEFGAWRVAAPGGGWQIDVEGMRGGSLAADLALRDFTVNAIAEPLSGGEPIDPLGGREDLRLGRLRCAGPTAFADDPLRVLRLVRVAVELGLEPDSQTLAMAREQAPRLQGISPERVFLELRRIMACDRAVQGLAMSEDVGAAVVVLPELVNLREVQQSRYHHRDVHDHTLEVLERAVALTSTVEPRGGLAGEREEILSALGAENAALVVALLREPLADGLTRGEALRWGALLHDVAKPATRAVRPLDRRVTFFGHDVQGAQLARDVLGRLRASVRLREHVAGLVRWHLRLGFLVHEPQPLAREQVFAYLRDCEPVEVDVTLLSVCDRLATRGAKAERAIEAHLALARAMLADALRWRAQGPPMPLLRGDELAAVVGMPLGPRVGELLGQLAEAQFAGRVSTREQALAFVQGL